MIKPEKLIPLPQDIYYKSSKKVEILSPEQVLEIVKNFGKKKKVEND